MTSAVGCSTCTTGGGCATHKGPQREAIAQALAVVYPAGVWGVLDDEAAFGRGVEPAECRRLAPTLSVAARAPVWFVPGGDGDLCNYVYVLCVGRTPSLVEVRERGASPDAAPDPDAGTLCETYLRVVFSTIARVASLQECRLELGPDGVIVERARPGVYDPVLLRRTRALVAALEAHGLEHLDFGLVDKACELAPGAYVERFGVAPKIVNYLYYAEPVETARIAVVPLAGGEAWIAADEAAEHGVEHA